MNGKRPLILAAIAAIAVTAVFFLFLLRPKMQQITDTREQIEQAQTQEQQLRAQLARLLDVRRDAPETRARLARVSDLLPSTPELPSFIRLLQDAASDEGVELLSIAPSAPSSVDDDIDSISVSLLIEGSFHRTEGFLAQLENLKRLVEVTSIAMTPVDDVVSGEFTLSSTLSLQMYVFKGGVA